jgi:hypothetical protein
MLLTSDAIEARPSGAADAIVASQAGAADAREASQAGSTDSREARPSEAADAREASQAAAADALESSRPGSSVSLEAFRTGATDGRGTPRSGTLPPARSRLSVPALAAAASLLLLLASFPAADAEAQIAAAGRPATPQEASNPDPDPLDYVIPLPCNLTMAFRPVFVTVKGYLGETEGYFGSELQSENDQTRSFSQRRRVFVGSPLAIKDLPEAYRPLATGAVKGDAQLDPMISQLYLMQKYETTVAQYDAVTKPDCPFDPKTAAYPVVNVSWYDAQGFSEKLMSWLLANHPEALPQMADEPRIVGVVRLPTEDEWEYAARGGHKVGKDSLSQEMFPMADGDGPDAYGIYYAMKQGAEPPRGPGRIGSRKPNPAGLYDTVGNASEMTREPYKITVGSRLHGSAGGFVRKGGSFRSTYEKVVPGAREELPYFYSQGPARSGEMGFRLVVSSMNGGSMSRISEISDELSRASTTDGTLVADDPVKLLDALIQSSESAPEKRALTELKGTLLSYNTAVNDQRRQSARSHLWQILYTMMSLRETNARMLRAEDQRGRELDSIKTIDDAMKLPDTTAAVRKRLSTARADRVKRRDAFQKIIEEGEVSYARLRTQYESLLAETRDFPKELVLEQLAALSRGLVGEDYFHKELRLCGRAVQMHVRSVLQGGNPSDIPRAELEIRRVAVEMPRA